MVSLISSDNENMPLITDNDEDCNNYFNDWNAYIHECNRMFSFNDVVNTYSKYHIEKAILTILGNEMTVYLLKQIRTWHNQVSLKCRSIECSVFQHRDNSYKQL